MKNSWFKLQEPSHAQHRYRRSPRFELGDEYIELKGDVLRDMLGGSIAAVPELLGLADGGSPWWFHFHGPPKNIRSIGFNMVQP